MEWGGARAPGVVHPTMEVTVQASSFSIMCTKDNLTQPLEDIY